MVYVTGSYNAFVCDSSRSGNCIDRFGCSSSVDFCIKRHDVRPAFKVKVFECDGTPMDLTGLILEASMWARGKLKQDITASDTYFALADGIGFEQCNVGDIIVMDRVRAPEQMLIIGFDESLKLIQVQRGYNGSLNSAFKKGTVLRIFRFLNAIATTEMDKQDIPQVDGSTTQNVLTESRLVYEWMAQDTCLPGCYYLEFKLLQMNDVSDSLMLTSQTPSFISYTNDQIGCEIGSGVSWVRRFPLETDGYLIKIVDSPTAENVF